MSSYDERIVQMQFDNSEFESGVSQTVNSVNRLNSVLNSLGVTSAFDNISSSAKNISLEFLQNSVDSVGNKFTMMEVLALRTMQSIADKAITTGETLLKSLSVDNISAGWSKFTSKTTSVATLVAQGYDIDTVSEQLDRLNWYTDETSYNFTDMVSNISKFTATGQDLKSSVTAMEGIANWAALSGQNATVASRAMYQLSQAMSKGALKYDDWKSIQNASMDTKEFREKAIEAAIAVGTLKKNAKGTYDILKKDTKKVKSAGVTVNELFSNDKLTKYAWLDTDTMMKVFSMYGSVIDTLYETVQDENNDIDTASQAMEALNGTLDEFGIKAFKAAQEARSWQDVIDSVKDAVSTGWMNSFELVFGNQKEATEFWTDLANALWDVFAASGETRNEILKLWKESGGRDDLIQSFWDLWDAISQTADIVGDAWETLFPSKTIEETADFLVKLTSKLAGFADTMKKLFNMTEEDDLFSAVQESGEIIDSKIIEPMNKALTVGDKIKNTFKGVFAIFDFGKTILQVLFEEIIKPGIRLFGGMDDALLDSASSLGDLIFKMEQAWKKSDVFREKVKELKENVKPLTDKFKELIKSVEDFIRLTPSIFTGNLITRGTILSGIVDTLSKGFQFLKDVVYSAWEKLKGLFSEDGPLNPGKIMTSLSTIPQKLGVLWNSIKEHASNAMNYVKEQILTSIKDGTFWKKVLTIITTSLSIRKAVSMIRAFSGIADITEIFGDLFGGESSFLGKFGKIGDMASDALERVGEALEELDMRIANPQALKTIAEALLMLAAALVAMSLCDTEKLSHSVEILAIALGELVGAAILLSKYTKNTFLDPSGNGEKRSIFESLLGGATGKTNLGTVAISLIALSAAVLILGIACKIISTIDTDRLEATFLTITVLIGELAVVSASLDGVDNSKSTKGIFKLAVAILVLAAAAKIIESIDPSRIEDTFVVIVAFVGELAAVAYVLNGNDMSKGTSGLFAFSVAILILAAACKIMESIDTDRITDVFYYITGFVGELTAVAVVLGQNSGAMIAGAGGFVLFSVSVLILAAACSVMASIDPDRLEGVIFTITAFVAELVVSAITLSANSGAMIAGAGGFVLFAVSILILAGACVILGNMSMDQITQGLTAIAILMIGLVITALVLTTCTPGIIAAAVAMLILSISLIALTAIIAVLGTLNVDMLVKGVITIATILIILQVAIMGLTSAIAGAVTLVLIAGALLILSAALTVLSMLPIPGLVVAVIALIVVFTVLCALTPALAVIGPTLLIVGASFLLLGVGTLAIAAGISALVVALSALGAVIVAAVTVILVAIKTLVGWFAKIVTIVWTALTKIWNFVAPYAGKFLSWLGSLLGKLGSKMLSGIKSIGSSMVSAFKNIDLKQVGIFLVDGLTHGMLSKIHSVVGTVKSIGSSIISGFKSVLGIASPSKVMKKLAGFVMEGLIVKMKDMTSKVGTVAGNVGEVMIDSMENSLSEIESTNIPSLNPTVTPSVDMSGMESATGLSRLFENDTLTGNVTTSLSSDTNQSLNTIVSLGQQMLEAIQNGAQITIDGKTVIGYVNRGLAKA